MAVDRPFAGALVLLREDRGFQRYEMGFMAYGLAWMMLQPTVPVFLVERLDVAYADVANARGLIYFTMIAACSHPFGRLLDRVGPLAVSRLAFALHDPAFKNAVTRQGSREEILEEARRVEAGLCRTEGGAGAICPA